MKWSELKVGQKVYDICGVSGRVEKILKTRVKIRSWGILLTYDKAHVQFLTKEQV